MHCALHAECKGLWVWYYMLCIVMLSPLSQGYSGDDDLGSIPEGLIWTTSLLDPPFGPP